jgi:hypothetical protein
MAKLFRLVHTVALLCLVLGIALIYIAALLNCTHYGTWPTYNNPESWSSYPIDTSWWPPVAPLFLLASLGLVTSLSFIAASLRDSRYRLDRNLSLVCLAGFAALIFDPWGVLNWYLD